MEKKAEKLQTTPPIRVMIVDDHLMVRRGLSLFVKSVNDLVLVGEVEDGESAVNLCPTVQPDVILMDLKMPGMDGVTATQLIHSQHPSIKILALTSYKGIDLINRALEAGAVGFLVKDITAIELAQAIRDAHAGKKLMSPEIADVLKNGNNHKNHFTSINGSNGRKSNLLRD